MPIRQTSSGPGLITPDPKRVDYGDPFANSQSVSYSASAGWINQRQNYGMGLSQMSVLSDLRQISSYKDIAKPLTVPSTVLQLGVQPGAYRNRTGSLELNMLDLGSTVRMAAGSYIGLDRPIVGTPGEGGPLDQALQAMSEYNRLPSRIMDYAVGLPLAWMGFQKASVGAKNPDGSTPQPFQQDPVYWEAISNASAAELDEMATVAAYNTVSEQMAPALKAQLLSIFKTDQQSLTGMSSGNERTDYLAKKQLETWADYESKYLKWENGRQVLKSGDPLFQIEANWVAKTGVVFGAFAKGAMTFLPFIGTDIAEALEPVSEETERRWASASAESRRSWLAQAQVAQLASDVLVTLPLFGGLGGFLKFAKAGAAGREFLPLIQKTELVQVGLGGERVLQTSESGNALMNIARETAFLIGKPGVRAPALLTEGGRVGRVMGGRFAVPETIHITNLYDGALHVAKLGLMEGIASWGINWGLKIASPTYAASYGRMVDESHWVSESSAAAAVDMIGLFTGGTLGASSLARVTGQGMAVPLSKLGVKASPFNFPYVQKYGGSGMTNLINRGLDEPLARAEAPFERHMMSVMQKWIQKGYLDTAAMNPERAAEIMAGATITRGEAMTQLGKILKAAEERTWGVETDAWRLQHNVARKQAQTLMNDIADLMETESGAQFWNRQITRLKGPDGRPLSYNPAGLKETARHLANIMGKDGDKLVDTIESSGLMRTHRGDRAQLTPWQQVVSQLHQRAFDGYQGILKGIRDSGTSESAAWLEIVRIDHLFAEDARRFLAEAEAVAGGAGDAALLESLRKQVTETPDFQSFWSRQKDWHGEGARKSEDASVDAIKNWLEQTEMHLPSRRVHPGPGAVDGELNQLHNDLDKSGLWTLAYRATEKTAAGTERAAAKQAAEELTNWVKTKGVLEKAADDAYEALNKRHRDLNDELWDKYVKPTADIQSRYVLQRMDATRDLQVIADKTSPAALALVKKIADLDVKIDAGSKKIDKAINRNTERLAKDPEIKRLTAAEEAARDASINAGGSKPLGYRIGPVLPDGYTPDLPDLMSGQSVATGTYLKYQMDAAKVIDPDAGTGIWHATADAPSVMKNGLMDVDEQVANLGQSKSALGGPRKSGYVSATWSKKHALAIAHRFEAAIEAANNRMSMEDLLHYFQSLPPSLTARGQRLMDALSRDPATGQHPLGFDAQGHTTGTMMLNKKGQPLTNSQYRAWLRKEIKAEMKRPYETPDQISAALVKGSQNFADVWNRKLNEFTAAKPQWGPNGELIVPEVKLANGMTLEQGHARLADIVDKYPGSFQASTTAAEKAEALSLTNQIMRAEFKAKHPLAPPTDGQKWDLLLETLDEVGSLNWGSKVTPQFDVLQVLDGRMDISPGGGVLILGDGSQFVGKTKAHAGVVRVSVNKSGKPLDFSGDPGEVKVPTEDSFVYRPMPKQAHQDPIEAPASQWSELGPEETAVSWVTLRDPRTGENVHVTTPYLEYPWQESLVQLGNRNFLARQFDNITAGYRTWRTTEYMKAQTYRLFTTKYEVEPAQVDALIGEVMRMGYEKWGPGGSGQRAKLGVPLGYQAVANLRYQDVTKAAGRIFGETKHPVTGEMLPAPIKNKITGEMEVPEYADMLVDGFRQAWTQNLTAALTSKFYTLGSMGYAGQIMGSYLAPLLRYTISPLFKTSELVESAQLNAMRGTPMVAPGTRAEYAAAGLPIKLGQIHSELAAGDMMSQGLMGGLPTVEEAQRLFPNGLADVPDLPWGYGLTMELKRVAESRRKDGRLPGWVRDGWENIKNPTIFKDPLAADLSVKVVRDELPLIMRKTNPTVYKHYSQELKVPDFKLADFIVQDRYLYQGWVNGTVTWQEMIAHQSKYNPKLAEVKTADLDAFYKSDEWAATEAMFRLTARTAQSEAFGVHYFGAYRSSLERSLNHPLLGVYPLSWAYKTAKEWFKFLFDNRVFGGGELRLGATPAAYIQSTMQGQAVAWAQNSDTSLDEWLQTGPLSNAFFMFNLLMPGDWANLPFPMSRSIRMIVRDGNLSPVDHIFQNLAGPRNKYGMGAIRDANLISLAITDGIKELTEADPNDWSAFTETLNSNGPKPPFDWDKVVNYPTRTLTQPLNAP